MTWLAVALLRLALRAVPLGPEAQQAAGMVPRIAFVISHSPVTQILGYQPAYPYLRAFLKPCAFGGTWRDRTPGSRAGLQKGGFPASRPS